MPMSPPPRGLPTVILIEAAPRFGSSGESTNFGNHPDLPFRRSGLLRLNCGNRGRPRTHELGRPGYARLHVRLSPTSGVMADIAGGHGRAKSTSAAAPSRQVEEFQNRCMIAIMWRRVAPI
jgi:hypothetical protein